MLVTTPFQLKTLLDSGIALPQIDLTLSATAPLSPQLAARAEAALGAPLMEIYGCTEAGQVATRRTTKGPEWHTYDGWVLSGDGDGDGDCTQVQGWHVPEPTLLADVLEVLAPQTFRLLGRSSDLINIAGKRSGAVPRAGVTIYSPRYAALTFGSFSSSLASPLIVTSPESIT